MVAKLPTLAKRPTLAESIEYYRTKVQKPRVEFLALAQSKGAITMEDVALEITHLSQIEAAALQFDKFVNGDQS
jgi:hypothetical protein